MPSGNLSQKNHEKIEYARQAAYYALQQLLPSDRISVTIIVEPQLSLTFHGKSQNPWFESEDEEVQFGKIIWDSLGILELIAQLLNQLIILSG